MLNSYKNNEEKKSIHQFKQGVLGHEIHNLK
jgi:hypothetical protein